MMCILFTISSEYQIEFNRQYLEQGNSTMEILYSALKQRWISGYTGVKSISICNNDLVVYYNKLHMIIYTIIEKRDSD